MLMTTFQLHGSADYDSHMSINTSTAIKDAIIAREFQKHLSDPTLKYGVIDKGKDMKWTIKRK